MTLSTYLPLHMTLIKTLVGISVPTVVGSTASRCRTKRGFLNRGVGRCDAQIRAIGRRGLIASETLVGLLLLGILGLPLLSGFVASRRYTQATGATFHSTLESEVGQENVRRALFRTPLEELVGILAEDNDPGESMDPRASLEGVANFPGLIHVTTHATRRVGGRMLDQDIVLESLCIDPDLFVNGGKQVERVP